MPFNRSLYPPDWPAISARIRERDGNRCRECGVPNGAYIVRDRQNPERYEVLSDLMAVEVAGAVDGLRAVRVVLTVAHLIEDGPLSCPDEDLAALCQRCHLRLDGPLHARHAAETRRRRRIEQGQGELLETAVS